MPLFSNETMAMPQLRIYACLVFNSLINTHGGMQHLMQTSQKNHVPWYWVRVHGPSLVGYMYGYCAYLKSHTKSACVCMGIVPTSKVGLS